MRPYCVRRAEVVGKGRFCGTTRRGATLIELTVAMFLVSLLLLGALRLFSVGSRYFRESQLLLEMQRSAVVAMASLTKELTEGSPASIRVYKATDGYVPGVVFGSPRNAQGEITFSPALQWYKIVCYYVDQINGVPCLVRKEMPLNAGWAPQNSPPYVGGVTTDDFKNNTALVGRVMARGVKTFIMDDSTPMGVVLELEDELQRGEFLVRLETKVNFRNR